MLPHSLHEPKWRRLLRFWRSDITADVDDELRFHFDARAEELRALGRSPAEIERTIADEFGDIEATRAALEIDEGMERRRALDRRRSDQESWGALFRRRLTARRENVGATQHRHRSMVP